MNNVFRKWPYIRHHWKIIMHHLTWRRSVNLVINQLEYLLRRKRLISMPPYIKIDPSIRCHLRCPGCPQSRDSFRASLPKKSLLTFEEFKKILDPLVETTFGISLSLYGEPLINKNIIPMIEYATSHNIGVWFPTNFSLDFNDEFFEKLSRSGLEKLVVSLDGTTKEAYIKYRVGGDFDLARNNVKRLADIKKRLGLDTPQIEWKFIIFDHNRNQVETVKREYRQWGFDSYFLVLDRRGDKLVHNHASSFKKRKSCFWLYNTIHVEVDGTIRPCCSNKPSWNIGNALTTDIRILWNNARYQDLRGGFSYINYGKAMDPVCVNCLGGDRLTSNRVVEK